MQCIHPCALTPEQYNATEAHRQVRPGPVCLRCEKAGPLHRHGCYPRGVTGSVGQVLEILVARFLCVACGGTLSFLPSFAQSYRLVQAATFEAFLEGKFARRDVQSWATVLRCYERRMAGYAADVFRIVGCGLGRAPPALAGSPALGPWLKEACGSLESATRRLVTVFRITPFQRYQCHQPAGP